MHKIHEKEFVLNDFSLEHLETISKFNEDNEPHQPYMVMKTVIDCLNACRTTYLKSKSKTDWWQMIQLLPSSYNQRRTVDFNYQTARHIYFARRNHKLDEWKEFCNKLLELPYGKELIGV